MKEYPDHHCHSRHFSPDASQTLAEICRDTLEKGCSSAVLAEHIDYTDAEEGGADFFSFDIDEYFRMTDELNSSTSGFRFYRGVELGWQSFLTQKYSKLVSEHKFDFVLLSIHTVEGRDVSKKDYFRGRSVEESVREYYSYYLRAVRESDDFHAAAHLDYIERYVPDRGLPHGRETKELIDAILCELIRKDRSLELNTSGRDYGLGDFHPGREIMERYYVLGGRKVTLGSDSHGGNTVRRYFPEAVRELREIGFGFLTGYRGGEPYETYI